MSSELEEQSRRLHERHKEINAKPVTALRLDSLKDLISSVESDQRLNAILGANKLEHLALVWDETQKKPLIAIADADIDERNRILYSNIIKEILEKNKL
ncbi:MAG: hypothetical protein V1875_00935 [Candidatus Altiarchaeota archaeon]